MPRAKINETFNRSCAQFLLEYTFLRNARQIYSGHRTHPLISFDHKPTPAEYQPGRKLRGQLLSAVFK